MTVVVAEAGPWIMLAAVLYLIYRWCERQDRLEAERERRYRERMVERYRRLEFEVGPPLVYDREDDRWDEVA